MPFMCHECDKYTRNKNGICNACLDVLARPAAPPIKPKKKTKGLKEGEE